jgi:hypothetical protein
MTLRNKINISHSTLHTPSTSRGRWAQNNTAVELNVFIMLIAT